MKRVSISLHLDRFCWEQLLIWSTRCWRLLRLDSGISSEIMVSSANSYQNEVEQFINEKHSSKNIVLTGRFLFYTHKRESQAIFTSFALIFWSVQIIVFGNSVNTFLHMVNDIRSSIPDPDTQSLTLNPRSWFTRKPAVCKEIQSKI